MDTAGQYLKKVREEKKISLQEVTEGTNIVKRHIVALEEDNYSIFAGETYVLGFLRSYATFLGADPEQAFQLYKGSVLEETETPLKELTEPTIQGSDVIKKYIKILFLPIFLIAIVWFIYLQAHDKKSNFLQNRKTQSNNSNNNIQITEQNSIPKIETENIKLSSSYNTTALIHKGKGINFSINNKDEFKEVYLILKEVNNKNPESSSAIFDFYPGKEEIVLQLNKPFLINKKSLPRRFKIILLGATANAVRIEIDQGEKKEVSNTIKTNNNDGPANSDNFIIIFDGYVERDTYVEFYVDGSRRKKGMLAKGSQLHFEANNTIQMKLGDPRALKITINGKAYSFGKSGQAITKVIRKKKDPIEQTKYLIDIR